MSLGNFDLMIGHQDSSPSNGHQGDMPYSHEMTVSRYNPGDAAQNPCSALYTKWTFNAAVTLHRSLSDPRSRLAVSQPCQAHWRPAAIINSLLF